MDGQPRVMGGRVDMGADEVTSLVGNLDADGDVDLHDYAVLRDHPAIRRVRSFAGRRRRRPGRGE